MAKTLKGFITSTGMNNTAVVEVFRQVPHPLYKKLLKRSKKYKVETEGKTLSVGDYVQIEETKPMSKDKYFKLVSIITSVKEVSHT
ncbi:MAG: 30S ribosomal protein S17 [Candidatus Levybacteria bacterium]|nr:30S ribosomal protein S17 [Candidatus Levybacteria bacterium]